MKPAHSLRRRWWIVLPLALGACGLVGLLILRPTVSVDPPPQENMNRSSSTKGARQDASVEHRGSEHDPVGSASGSTGRGISLLLGREVGPILGSFLEEFKTEEAYAQGFVELIQGSSPFFDREDVRKHEGVKRAIRIWTLAAIQSRKLYSSKARSIAFDGTLEFVCNALEADAWDPELRNEALNALAPLAEGNPEAGGKMGRFIEKNLDSPQSSKLIDYSGRAPLSQGLETALWKAFRSSKDERVRDSAGSALARRMLGNPAIRETLVLEFGQHNESVRAAIVEGLEAYPPDSQALRFAGDALRADPSDGVKERAIHLLSLTREVDESTAALIRSTLTSQSPRLRRSAAAYLSSRGNQQDLVALESLANTDPDPDVRNCARKGVETLKDRLVQRRNP